MYPELTPLSFFNTVNDCTEWCFLSPEFWQLPLQPFLPICIRYRVYIEDFWILSSYSRQRACFENQAIYINFKLIALQLLPRLCNKRFYYLNTCRGWPSVDDDVSLTKFANSLCLTPEKMSVKLKNTRRLIIPHHCETKAWKAHRIQAAKHFVQVHYE